MSKTAPVEHDERTVAVENTGGRWAYAFVSFALLIDVMWRAVFRHEAAWDLVALVIASGVVSAAYQVREQAWTRRQTRMTALAVLLATILGVAIAGLVIALYGGRL